MVCKWTSHCDKGKSGHTAASWRTNLTEANLSVSLESSVLQAVALLKDKVVQAGYEYARPTDSFLTQTLQS